MGPTPGWNRGGSGDDHRVMRAPAVLLAVPFLLFAAACGDDDESSSSSDPADCTAAVDGEVTIVADDLDWEVDCLTAPAGEPLTVIVDNQDEGVNHNIHFTDAPEQPKTELRSGLVVQELEVDLEDGRSEEHTYELQSLMRN